MKTQGRANTFFGKKNQNSPALPPPQEKTYFPLLSGSQECGKYFTFSLVCFATACDSLSQPVNQIQTGDARVHFTILDDNNN